MRAPEDYASDQIRIIILFPLARSQLLWRVRRSRRESHEKRGPSLYPFVPQARIPLFTSLTSWPSRRDDSWTSPILPDWSACAPICHPFKMPLPLPDVNSVVECADFGRTVFPFLAQLKTLPASLIEAGTNVDDLKEIYLHTNPFVTAIAFALALCPLFLIASEINKNYSQVDRFWSILPAIYTAHYATWARLAGLSTSKINTVAVLTAIWGVRNPRSVSNRME